MAGKFLNRHKRCIKERRIENQINNKTGYVIMVEQGISNKKALFLWAIVLEYLTAFKLLAHILATILGYFF
jgi:hypothetical protein